MRETQKGYSCCILINWRFVNRYVHRGKSLPPEGGHRYLADVYEVSENEYSLK